MAPFLTLILLIISPPLFGASFGFSLATTVRALLRNNPDALVPRGLRAARSGARFCVKMLWVIVLVALMSGWGTLIFGGLTNTALHHTAGQRGLELVTMLAFAVPLAVFGAYLGRSVWRTVGEDRANSMAWMIAGALGLVLASSPTVLVLFDMRFGGLVWGVVYAVPLIVCVAFLRSWRWQVFEAGSTHTWPRMAAWTIGLMFVIGPAALALLPMVVFRFPPGIVLLPVLAGAMSGIVSAVVYVLLFCRSVLFVCEPQARVWYREFDYTRNSR